MKILDILKNKKEIAISSKEEYDELAKYLDMYGLKFGDSGKYTEWSPDEDSFILDINTGHIDESVVFSSGIPAKDVIASEKSYRLHDPSKFKVGDKVKVVCRAESGEGDWDNSWNSYMDKFIGNTYEIIDIGIRGDYKLSDWYFPSFCLELVEEKSEDWCVQVTKENREAVKRWMDNDDYDFSTGYYYGIRNSYKDTYKDSFGKVLSTEEFYEKTGVCDLSNYVGRYLKALVDNPDGGRGVMAGQYGKILNSIHADFPNFKAYSCGSALLKPDKYELMPEGFEPPSEYSKPTKDDWKRFIDTLELESNLNNNNLNNNNYGNKEVNNPTKKVKRLLDVNSGTIRGIEVNNPRERSRTTIQSGSVSSGKEVKRSRR